MSEGRKPRVLVIASYLPFPLDRGDPVRVDMYLRALNEIADLTVLITERESSTDEDVTALRQRIPGATIRTFRPASTYTSRRFAPVRWMYALSSGKPSWIANRFSQEIRDHLADKESDYDCCFFLGEAAGQYISMSRNARNHWDKSNVLAASAVGDVAETRPFSLQRGRKRLIAHISTLFERRTLHRTQSISVTSDHEAERLRLYHNARADFVHPSTVEGSTNPSNINAESKTVLWLGSFQYHSNINGLMKFIQQGLPALRKNGYRLRLVGSGAEPELVQKLSAIRGIEYIGFVDDLHDAVDGCRAAVVPLWSGAGVKIKTLTLMGLGLPVAATSVAMEGITSSAALVVSDVSETLAVTCMDASAEVLAASRMAGLKLLQEEFSERAFFDRVRDQVMSRH